MKITEDLVAVHFSQEQAKAIARVLVEREGELVTKDFLRAELAELRTELRGEIAALRIEMRTEISGIRTDVASVRTEIARVESALFWKIGGVVLLGLLAQWFVPILTNMIKTSPGP